MEKKQMKRSVLNFVLALALAIAFKNSAVAERKLGDPTDDPSVVAAAQAKETAKAKQDEEKKPAPVDDGHSMLFWVVCILGGGVVLIIAWRWFKKRSSEDGHDDGSGGGTPIAAIAILFLVASAASAAPCYNKDMRNRAELVVTGQPNTIVCDVALKSFEVVDDTNGGKIAVSNITVKGGKTEFTISPAKSGYARVFSTLGRRPVAISDLYFMQGHLLGTANTALRISGQRIDAVKTEVEATGVKVQQAGVRADAAMERATKAGLAAVALDDKLAAISTRVGAFEQRLLAVENRPTPRGVDLTPMERRITTLEAELAQVRTTARSALSAAQQADAKGTDTLAKYEDMGLARFRTGIFKSKTVTEATEAAKK